MTDTDTDSDHPVLLSDEPTMVLVVRAKSGDEDATAALLERCIKPLKRWAHGRLPTGARGVLDTDDIVQSAVIQFLRRLPHFEPQHVGAMQAYLRQSVINRIRDEVRRLTRQPAQTELPEHLTSDSPSQLELAIQSEDYTRYRDALTRLRPKDRELIVARIEMQWTLDEIADQFGIVSVEAARMAVMRAARRLKDELTAGCT
jgi:RNA polymerase sigma factor (sigma-70 family)